MSRHLALGLCGLLLFGLWSLACGGGSTHPSDSGTVDSQSDSQGGLDVSPDSGADLDAGIAGDSGDAVTDLSEITDDASDTVSADAADSGDAEPAGHLTITVEHFADRLAATVFLHEDTGISPPGAPAIDSCSFSTSTDSGVIDVPPLGFDLGTSVALSRDVNALLLLPDVNFSYTGETAATFFAANSSYTAIWNGGDSTEQPTFPAASVTVSSPKQLTGLSPDPQIQTGLSIPTDQPLSFGWTKSDDGNSEVWIRLTHLLPGPPQTTSIARCRAADDGSFEVSKDLLAQFPIDAQHRCLLVRVYRERRSTFSHARLLSSAIVFRDIRDGTFCFQ